MKTGATEEIKRLLDDVEWELDDAEREISNLESLLEKWQQDAVDAEKLRAFVESLGINVHYALNYPDLALKEFQCGQLA